MNLISLRQITESKLQVLSGRASGGFPSPAADHYKAPISLDDLVDLRAPHVLLGETEGDTAESEDVLASAKPIGVTHVVGLQRRFSPSSRYWHDLVQQGYVGKPRSVRMSVGVDAFSDVMPEAVKWAVDPANFTHLLPVYGEHFLDMLFHGLEFPHKLAAVAENQLPVTIIKETSERIPYDAPNEVLVIGTFPEGGAFSIQLEGGQAHPTGLQIEVTGTKGFLRIVNARGFQNADDS